MRLIKMLGLAAIAAMAAMAFIGASSASADPEHIVLCEIPDLFCEEENQKEEKVKRAFPNPTTIIGHATSPKLLSSVGTVECEKSLAELTLLNTLSTLILGHILSLSFEGNCHLGGTTCSVTVGETGGISFTKTGPLTASAVGVGLPLTGLPTMLTKATVKCAGFINCTYDDSTAPLLSVSSTAGGVTSMVANKTKLGNGTGFLCPETSEWDAEYVALGVKYIES